MPPLEMEEYSILMTLLEQKYAAIERIRDRVYSLSISAIGVFLTVAALIVQNVILLTLIEKIFFGLGALFAFGVVCYYIRDLEKGFCNQFMVVVKIEKRLGLYQADPDEESLYPSEWETVHTPGKSRSGFFRSTTLLLVLGALALLGAIALSGILF
jgi:hypothetical protein